MVAREVGTLWIGGDLSWLEQLCLKSFVDKGQKITLFHYDEVGGVPEGVILRDGREIIDTDDFIKYKSKDSYALFADWFRLHMVHKCSGMIWIDTDVYCWQPMEYESDMVFGRELYGRPRINNAVVGLPSDDPMLLAMIEFTDNRYPAPPFFRPNMRAEIEEARARGEPVHITEMKWGVWGPMMFSHFVRAFDYMAHAKPVEAFYPVTFPDRKLYMRAPKHALNYITPDTTALHLWASLKRPLGYKHNGLPPKGSFLDRLCEETEIDPKDAPILSRGVHKFEHVEEEPVEEKKT